MNARVIRSFFCLFVLFTLGLAACAPAPAAGPTTAPTDVPPTLAPTQTRLPPTATVVPTVTPLPPTATHTPKPSATIPAPTATTAPTATPGPGDVVYQGHFADDWQDWEEIYFGTDKYTLEPAADSFTIMIDGLDTWVYTFYDHDFDYADVQVDVDVQTISGPNRNNLSVVCRYNEAGWYEFNIESGGLWNILRYSEDVDDWTLLKSGGSTAIRMNQATNHLTAVCQGDVLTLYINDVKVGSVKDTLFTSGTFGVSASTFKLPHVQMRFSGFTVRLADPNAQLGQAAAPTVAPTAAGSGGGGGGGGGSSNSADWIAGLYTLPLPGETIADATLQQDTLNSLLVLLLTDVPTGCGQVHVVSTTFVGITAPLEYDAQGNPIAGTWQERWVVDHCGSQSAYRMTYSFNPNGGVDFRVGRWQ